jgi:hypothetical protein
MILDGYMEKMVTEQVDSQRVTFGISDSECISMGALHKSRRLAYIHVLPIAR